MLREEHVQALFDECLAHGADFAELFLEERDDLSMDYSGQLDGVACVRAFGAGLYLLRDTQGAYVYSNDVSPEGLHRAAEDALALLMAEDRPGGKVQPFRSLTRDNPCPVRVYPSGTAQADKLRLLRDTYLFGREEENVRSLQLTWYDRDQRVTIYNSEGTLAQDRRVTTRMRFIPVVEKDGAVASTFSEYCASAGMEAFFQGQHMDRLKHAIANLRGSLSAVEAPSCRVPVILEAGGCSGTFFHEACGHQLETRSLLEGGLFWDRRGQKIASDCVTLVDDGTMPGMYGSARFDDEGMPRQKNILIENGILRGFMADRLGARRLHLARTGSGRRQDYMHAPGPRMSNTYLAPGQDDEDAMLRDLDEGLFVTEIGGGTGGREFTLLASTAYWVRNGRIHHRVKGATLVGRGDETMLKIDRVGRRFVTEEGGGSFCGADSGFIPTTTSGPRMRIAQMLVGGKGEA